MQAVVTADSRRAAVQPDDLGAEITRLTSRPENDVEILRHLAAAQSITEGLKILGEKTESAVVSDILVGLYSVLELSVKLAGKLPLSDVSMTSLENIRDQVNIIATDIERSRPGEASWVCSRAMMINQLTMKERERCDMARLVDSPARSIAEMLESLPEKFRAEISPSTSAEEVLFAYGIVHLRHPVEIQVAGYELMRARFMRYGNVMGFDFIENIATGAAAVIPDSTQKIWSAVASKLRSDLRAEGLWLDQPASA